MATNVIKIDISNGSVDKAVAKVVGKVLLKIGTTGKARAQQIIGEEIKDRSGRLKAGTDFKIVRVGDHIELHLENSAGAYALYQHEGTGIYGPKKRPIRPVNGKFLVWTDPDTGETIFATEVRGTPGKKFLSRAASFAIKRVLG